MEELREKILNAVENLNINKSGSRRSPHKPLLLLIAISRLLGGQNTLNLADLDKELLPLLKAYAPPVKGSHQPELPYWHLQSSGLWTVSNADFLPLQSGGFPKMPGLRQTHAGFTNEVASYLKAHPIFASEIVDFLLSEHFPESVQVDLVARLGLDREAHTPVLKSQSKKRDPAFRNNVLRAYDYRCAVTGFQAMLGGASFGCEAAHVRWHAYDGPDIVSNGIALEPTLHKLFDAGAWTLDDERRILVSKDFTGSDTALARLRDHHGQKLASPIPGEPLLEVNFIMWHREPELGGVFRQPALQI